MNTIGSVEAFGRDLRYALRALGRHRSFTLAVVMTLAVGLGANTAIFAVVDGVLIKPLPYPDAEQLVSLAHDAPGIKIDDLPMSPTQYFTYRDEGRVFQYLGLYADRGTTITGSGEPEQVAAVIATHDVLQALGVRPVLGRLFTEEDATTAAPAPQTMVLTYGYWQRRFGGDRSIVGRRLAVDSRPAEIVGVLPEGFRFLDMKPQPEILLPMRVNRAGLQIDNFGLRGLARLKPGATIAEANADVARMLPLWLNAWPIPSGPMDRAAMENWRIAPRLKPLKDDVVGGLGDMLWFLTGTIGIVLLIACANVANLMLVRSEGRRQEFAVRRALGSGGRQIARSVLTESVVIALAGGALGVGLAYLGVTVLIATAPATLPRLDEISLDPRVVVFAIVISLASSLLFGLIPAFKHARGHQSPMPNVVREGSASRERQRTRNTLVVVQVALALVLLVSAGLMFRTFQAMRNVEPGFDDPATVQTARIWIPAQQVRELDRTTRMQHEIVEKIAAIPGVTAAGFASALPMEANFTSLSAILVEGRGYAAGTTPPNRRFKTVSPGYFGAIGTRVIAGRDITWNDIDAPTRVAIISENFAREVWRSPEAALGHRIREPVPGTPVWREIVGVVQDVHEDALHQTAPSMVYFPVFMESFGGAPSYGTRAINLVIRSDQAGTQSLVSAIRNAVTSVNPALPVFLVRTMKDFYDESLARTSFALVMLAIAGAMALGLGLIGIYGVLSYVVSQRTKDIGIRLALGATPRELEMRVVLQGFVLASIGLTAGLAAAVALTRLMSSLLFGVTALDPPTYAGVLAVVLIATALASYLPARRAARLDPVSALRSD